MNVHDTVAHSVTLSSDSHLALTCWEMAHTLLILLCGLSNLPFPTYLFARFISFCAVERETRKGVSYTSVCSDFCSGWLVPLGIRVLISLKWSISSLMCSVWHISAAGCLGDNWEGRGVLNTVSGWRSLSSETSVKGVKDSDSDYYYYFFFFLFFSYSSSIFFSSVFSFSPFLVFLGDKISLYCTDWPECNSLVEVDLEFNS